MIIGAAKSATTSLHHYLGQHPQILMSRDRWTRFFHIDAGIPNFKKLASQFSPVHLNESIRRYRMMCHEGVPRTLDQYLQQWPTDQAGVLLGESSPTYLYHYAAHERIKERFPEVKLLIVLRQPADRAFSHFKMDLRRGWIKDGSFQEALQKEPAQVMHFWWGMRQYFRQSIYAPRIAYLQKLFSSEQIKIMFYDDLQKDTQAFMKQILEFLGVDSSYNIDDSLEHNTASADDRAKAQVNASARTFNPELRNRLTTIYRPDIEKVQEITGVDLSHWLRT